VASSGKQRYLTSAEAGDELGLPKDEVDNWCQLFGRRHGVLFLTGAFLIPASALIALQRWAKHGTDPPPE
jgi:hypothetical protein